MQTDLGHEQIIVHRLKDYLTGLGHHRSTRSLKKSLIYKSLETEITRIFNVAEFGFYAPELTTKKKALYPIMSWNLGGGVGGINEILSQYPELSQADVILLQKIDSGMARSHNINIARDLAQALKMNYCFAPCYLNVGSHSLTGLGAGENLLGLEGNAILSRYPIENRRVLSLPQRTDPMKGADRKIGCQKAMIVDIVLPYQTVTMVCHDFEGSTSRQQLRHLSVIMNAVETSDYPVLISGNRDLVHKKNILKRFFQRQDDSVLIRELKNHHFNFECFGKKDSGYFATRRIRSESGKWLDHQNSSDTSFSSHDATLLNIDIY